MSEVLKMDRERYIFVHRIDKTRPVGETIPLHATLLHWFSGEVDINYIIQNLEETLAGHQPMATRAIKEAMFGPDKDKPVMCLERTDELLALHKTLLGLAKAAGGQWSVPWIDNRWNPHVTHTPETRLELGEEVVIKDVDLIVGQPDGTRELIASAMLETR